MINKKQARKIAYAEICDLISAQIAEGWSDGFISPETGNIVEDTDEIAKVIEQVKLIVNMLEKRTQ